VFAFFQCVAEAVVENGAKGLLGMIPGGAFAVGIAGGALAKYKQRKRDEALRDEIAQMAAVSASEARKVAAEAVQAAAGSATPEEKAALEGYLAQIPAAVTQSLKRPNDPTGKTVPAAFALTTPDDVLRLLPPRPPRFRVGDILPGRSEWRLERVLGVGGFGEVWLARHTDMGVAAAVKFCHGPQASDLRHESQVIAQVMKAGDHPSVVPLRDAVLSGETPWLRFDLIDGGDLGDIIRVLMKQPAEERAKKIVQALRQIAGAVGHFHKLTPAVVHRDLKPSNILYDRTTKRLKVTDFGIGAVTAKATLTDEANNATTRSGRMLSSHRGSHTPIYAGPQQCGGSDPDPRDDVHALGVIAYQMLTGNLLQGPGTDYALDLADAGAPQPLIDLIGRCVSKNAARRPATAAVLADELDALLAPPPRLPPQPPPPVPPVPVPPAVEAVPPPVPPPADPQPTDPDEEEADDDKEVGKDDLPDIDPGSPPEEAAPEPEYEVEVVVSGNWRMNRVQKPFARWRLVSKLPAKVKVKPGEVYKLDVMRSAKDANVQGLTALANVKALNELDLTGCKRLTDEAFKLVAQLTHLETLILSESSAGDTALKHVARLPNLHTLNLAQCGVTEAGLAFLKPLRRTLTTLYLNGLDLSAVGVSHLASLRQLECLVLNHTPLSDAGLAVLTGLTKLEYLNLDSTRVTDEGVALLSKLTRLDNVDLSCTAVTDRGLEHVAGLRKLEWLWLGGCKGITDGGLAALRALKKLELLSVPDTAVTDAGVEFLRAVPRLADISLEGCAGVTDASIDHLLAMANLTEVDLTGTGVTAEGAARLVAALPDCTVYHESFGESDATTDEGEPSES
jgi:serine/threonine protein kinase